MPYLTYLSLVHGVGLDYELLLGPHLRQPVHPLGPPRRARCGCRAVRPARRPADPARLRRPVPAAAVWPLGRMLLHRGDPDLTALSIDDLDELRAAVEAFTARLRSEPLREFYARPRDAGPRAGSGQGLLRHRDRPAARRARAAVPHRPGRPAPGRPGRRRHLGASGWRPAGTRRGSGPSSSATCGCTWTRTWTGRRPSVTPATRCAG